MNSLSWLIYLAGVSQSLSVFLVLLCVVSATVGMLLTVIAIVCLGTRDSNGYALANDRYQDRQEIHKSAKRWAVRFGILFVVFGMFSNLLPERKTVLLIAASEIGERTLNSEKMAAVGARVNSVIDPSIELLNTWIVKQTEELRADMNRDKPNKSRN